MWAMVTWIYNRCSNKRTWVNLGAPNASLLEAVCIANEPVCHQPDDYFWVPGFMFFPHCKSTNPQIDETNIFWGYPPPTNSEICSSVHVFLKGPLFQPSLSPVSGPGFLFWNWEKPARDRHLPPSTEVGLTWTSVVVCWWCTCQATGRVGRKLYTETNMASTWKLTLWKRRIGCWKASFLGAKL